MGTPQSKQQEAIYEEIASNVARQSRATFSNSQTIITKLEDLEIKINTLNERIKKMSIQIDKLNYSMTWHDFGGSHIRLADSSEYMPMDARFRMEARRFDYDFPKSIKSD